MSYFLDTARLTGMRADLAKMLPGTAIIQAATTAADGRGGFTETWAAVAGGTVACRLDPFPSAQQIDVAGAQEAQRTMYTLTLPWNAPIETGNRVSVAGTIYDVRNIYGTNSWAVSRRATVTRID